MATFNIQGEELEAVQFTPLTADKIEEFVGGDMGRNENGENVVATRQGALVVGLNDWVVKAKNGTFFTCKPDLLSKGGV